jgi:hypothetical protein
MVQSACHHGRMADRQDSDREVLTSLPRSRPVRRSAKRDAPKATADAASTGSATPKPASSKKPAAPPRRKAGTSKARAAAGATTSRPKSASTASSKAGAGDRARAPRSRAAAGAPRREAAPRPDRQPQRERVAPPPDRQHRPERVAPPRKVPPAGYAAAATRGESDGSDATKLLSTAVQAANELTQIGLTVGRQALQSMLDRLPKP